MKKDIDKVIAVTGGIGAGKSMVCRILSILGYPVYDCDSNARHIMENDVQIKNHLREEISFSAVDSSGCIDRKAISRIVFNNHEKLKKLNAIVHGAVLNDIEKWIGMHKGSVFIETAILYQSGIDRIVDEVWEILAPIETRISRVCLRNNLSEEEVMERINSQIMTGIKPHKNIKTIINDNKHSLLLQISQQLCN